MRNKILFSILLICAFSVFPLLAESDAELIAIAAKVASGTATPKEQAIAFKYNKEINNLAMGGKIDKDVYQKNQKKFDSVNSELAANAAAKNGLDTSGKSKDSYKAGTDSDIQLSSKNKKLTSDDVVKARNDYNREVDSYLKKNGVETKGNENWAKKTETDIMPSPDQMTPAEFKKSAEFINKDGGNMYKNKDAADTQLKIDSKSGVSLDDGPAYTKELQGKVRMMKNEKAELEKELKNTSDPERKAHLETEIKKSESHEAKYIDRINKLNEATKEQYKIDSTGPQQVSSGDKALKDAQSRDFARSADGKMGRSEKGAHVTDSMDRHMTNKALENYNNTIAEIGRDPQYTKKSQAIIAENIKGLPPAQQGEAISNLENKFGKDFAKGVTENVRTSGARTPASPSLPSEHPVAGVKEPQSKAASASEEIAHGNLKKQKTGASVAAALGFITAGLNSYNEELEIAKRENRKPDYGKMLGNTVYNATIGGYISAAENTLKAVTTDTLEYRRKLEDDYKKSGADMGSFSTQFKIWAQTTIYGTGLGIWQGAHAVPLVGDVLGAGETVVAVTGESLATMDELNAQSANIQNQEMNQRLTDAQSLRKAEKLLNSMELLRQQSRTLKAELNKNCEWVQDTSGKYISWKSAFEDKLKEYQKVFNSTVELKDKNQKAAIFSQNYAAGAIKDFTSIKIQAVYHAKRAGELMKQHEESPVKPEERKTIQDIIEEHKLNNGRFENRLAEMRTLSDLSLNGGMAKYLQKLKDNIKSECESAKAVADNSVTASKNIDTLVKQISEMSKNLSQMKLSLKNASVYFSKKDEKLKAAWADIDARAALVKDIDFNAGDYKRDQDFIRRFPGSVDSYVKGVKIQEPGDLSWLDADVKNSEKVLASLRKPAEETAMELDKAAGKMMFLAGLLNLKSCIVNVAVLDEATGNPVMAAKVSLSGNGFSSSATSNAGGAGFSDVPEGNFNIEVFADGYSGASLKISIAHASSQEYREVLKLKRQNDQSGITPQAAGDIVSEATKIAKDDEKKYASVSPEDLKKAKPMIDASYNAIEKGNFINYSSMLLQVNDISDAIRRYLDVKFSNAYIRLMLLDKANGRNDLIYQKLSRTAAASAIEMACRNNNNYSILAVMKNGIDAARQANVPLDSLTDTARAFLDFRIKQGFASTVNFSSLKYWKAYAAFYDPKTKKSNNDKPVEIKAEDAEKWVEFICKGGYDAVAKELEKFWGDKTDAGEKSKFLRENPNAAEDYRNAYISCNILPALALWAKNMKAIKEKEFAATIGPLLQPLVQTGIVFSGSVKCFPESAPWKVMLREDMGQVKEITEKTMSGDGEYSFSFKLSDLTESGIGVKIEPVMEKINELYRSGGDVYSFRAYSSDSTSAGTRISVEGSTIKVVFPQSLITSAMRTKNIQYDAPAVPVPSMPANKTMVYRQLIIAPYNSFRAGTISLEEAEKKTEHIEKEFYMVRTEFEDKYNAVFSAITHNMDIKRREYDKQRMSKESEAVMQEIRNTNDARYKEMDKIRAAWDFSENGRRALNAARSELFKKRDALYARKKQRDDAQSALRKEYSEAIREFQNILGDWTYVPANIQGHRVNRIGSPTANADVLDEYMDKELLKAIDKLKNNLNNAAEKIAAISGKAAAWMSDYAHLNKEINQCVRERHGLWKGIDYDDSNMTDNVMHSGGMNGPSWYYDIREITWVAESIGKSEMKNFIDKNLARTDAYFKKKGGYSQDIEALLTEAKTVLEKLSPEKAAGLSAELKTLMEDMYEYVFFFENAVLLSDPSSFKTDKFSDPSGSDLSFITDARKKLDALTASYKDYLSDKLFPPERVPSAFGRSEELIYELRLRGNDMNDEQRKKFYAMQDKYNKISTAAGIPYNFGNIKLVIDEAAKTGAKTPAERIKKIIQANSEAVNYMKRLSVPSDPGELEKFLSDADKWFGKMRGPPTLDSLKARGELYSKLYRTGVLNAYRKAHNMPPGPESFIMNGKPYPYDGSTIVLRYSQLQPVSPRTAEAYAKSGIKNITRALFTGFKKNSDYRMERASYNLNNFNDAGDGSYTAEDPMGTEWLPRIVKVCFRQCDKNGNSRIPNEPPVTIIVLP